MSETYESFKPSELKRISFTCPGCHVKITFDILRTEKHPVDVCQNCGGNLDGLRRTVMDYKAFQQTAAASKLDFTIETDPA